MTAVGPVRQAVPRVDDVGPAGRAPGRPAATAPPRRPVARGSSWWPLLFIGPTAAGLLVFFVWPTVRTVALSLTKVGPFGGSTFVGTENYARLLQDPDLVGALLNTFAYAGITLLGLPIAVVISALLNTRGLRGVSIYRMLYFLPVVTMPVAVAIVWRMLYNGDYGIINQALGLIGIDGRSWLTDADTALIAVAAVGIWGGLGTSIVIFLAGLQGIPPSLLEAASLDGAGPVRTFWSVTVPLLTPSIFFVTVLHVIGSLQVFDLLFIMIGPASPMTPRTRSIVMLFYQAGFLENDRGYAAAIAVVLLILILTLTVLQFGLQRRWVHYG